MFSRKNTINCKRAFLIYLLCNKIKRFYYEEVISFSCFLFCNSSATRSNRSNPFAKYGFKKVRAYTSSKGEFEEFHDNKDVVEIGSILFDTKTNQVVGYAKEEAESEITVSTSAMSIDPLCEKYYWISPYAYCLNNPLRFIDPDGKDVYRYDDKTGDFILAKQTEDKFDQVGKFKYDKKTGEYTLQTDKSGNAKTRIDNVEKGILSDGINFMNNNNAIATGGEGQATVGGVEAFAVNLSDMVGKEIGGAYFSLNGSSETTHMTIGAYRNNKFDETRGHGIPAIRSFLTQSTKGSMPAAFFHTHPSNGNISILDRTRPSGKDIESKNNDLKKNPSMLFYILTHPEYYGGAFPNKINYTNW